MPKTNPKCWICGAEGTTGEHMTKRSDLRSVFGTPCQQQPIFLHDAKRRNQAIGSLDNKRLKSPARICADCNNARTQPYDRAWEIMSSALRSRTPQIAPGAVVRANRIFKTNTRSRMVDVHLFFVKLFGCHIVADGIPIDTAEFSRALLLRVPHPEVYLKLGQFAGMPIVGMSGVEFCLDDDGSCVFAAWLYEVDRFAVSVMFAVDGQQRKGLTGAWHPKLGTNKLITDDFG